MHRYLCASLVLVAAIHGFAALDASAPSPVPPGATPAQVEQALGKPRGQFSAGGLTIWTYPRGEVQFRNGLVSGVQWRETAPVPEQPAETDPAAAATTDAGADPLRRQAGDPARRKRYLPDGTNRTARARDQLAADAPSLPRELAGPVSWLLHGSERERRDAADRLAALADPRAWDPLVNALGDRDEGVRLHAFEALRRIDAERAFDALAQIALQHSNQTWRCGAIGVLPATGHPRAVAVLVHALADSDNRHAVATALLALRETALPELQVASRGPDPTVRRNAVFALDRFGPVAEARLLEALRDPDAGVRGEALRALCPLKSGAARDAVRPLLSDADDAVRRAAEGALREAETRDEEMRLRQAEDARREEKRRVADVEARIRQRRNAAISLAIACACAALGVLWAFHFEVRARPLPIGARARLLCLAAGTAMSPAVLVVFARCYAGIASPLLQVFLGVLDVVLTMLAASWPMACLRAVWKRTDEALAGTTPRDGYAHLSVDGFTFLALAGVWAAFAWYHVLGTEVRLLTLTAACAATCGLLSAVNLRNRARVLKAMQESPAAEPDPFDLPERPAGVAFISLLAIGIGLAATAYGYWAVASSLHSATSTTGGFGILIGAFLLFFVGLPVVWAGRCAYLLEKGGRDLLIALFSLLCVGPLIPVALPILIYLRRRAVKDVFALRDDTPTLTPEEKLRRWEARYWTHIPHIAGRISVPG